MKLDMPKRILITSSMMAAAILCYLVGYMPGMKGFFFAGIVFETIFWVRLLHNCPRRKERLDKLKAQTTE